jgi:hypothetical protein
MRTRRLVGLVVLSLAGCGGDSPDPQPKPVAGDLVVSLVTPFPGQDGGMVIRMVGPIESVTGLGGYVVSSAVQGNVTRTVVTGNIVAGDLLRIRVPDVAQNGLYTVFVEQAASRTTYALFDVSGYQLLLRRP